MKKITLIAFLITTTIVTYGQWSGSTDINNDIWRYGNVGIGTTSPNSTAPGPLLEISSNGDFFPVFRLERINGVSKTDRAWETFISSNGSYYIRDVSTTGFTDPFIIQTGAPANSFNIANNGNIGFGLNSPKGKLHIQGSSERIIFSADAINQENSSRIEFWESSDASISDNAQFAFQYDGLNDMMRFKATLGTVINKDLMVIKRNGNVGIGTIETGTHRLAVEGTIGAREIKVEADGWSDFVFKKDYKLKDLEEVENFIEENNHLPDIPSEKEVQENGIQLGEMDAKLLQKIEELTLYMIDINKEVRALRNENTELKEKVMKLETME